MCWMCDHPGATDRDYHEHLREVIAAFGWAVQGVEREGRHPPWAYTVGLTGYRKPELVVTGNRAADEVTVEPHDLGGYDELF